MKATDNPPSDSGPDKGQPKPEAQPKAPHVTLIPNLFREMTADEALRHLRGKSTDIGQRAILTLIRYTREDVLDAGTSFELSERQSGYYAGAAHILRELEQQIVCAHIVPIDAP
jgi:hypothetical protein